MIGERLFHGDGSVGPFHYYRFKLAGRGAYTLLHAHEHDHLVSADKPIAIYVLSHDGIERVAEIPHFDRRLVAAHTQHLIFSLEDGDTECECLFSRYDQHGAFIGDPKEPSRQPYREPCDPATLPALALQCLREHSAAPLAL